MAPQGRLVLLAALSPPHCSARLPREEQEWLVRIVWVGGGDDPLVLIEQASVFLLGHIRWSLHVQRQPACWHCARPACGLPRGGVLPGRACSGVAPQPCTQSTLPPPPQQPSDLSSRACLRPAAFMWGKGADFGYLAASVPGDARNGENKQAPLRQERTAAPPRRPFRLPGGSPPPQCSPLHKCTRSTLGAMELTLWHGPKATVPSVLKTQALPPLFGGNSNKRKSFPPHLDFNPSNNLPRSFKSSCPGHNSEPNPASYGIFAEYPNFVDFHFVCMCVSCISSKQIDAVARVCEWSH